MLASSRGERAPRIAEHLGCDDQTVLDALQAFNAQGLEVLKKGSFRPKHTPLVFGPEQAEQLRALVHRPPRDFGYPTSVWTLDLAAQASVEQGLVTTRVSGETIRQTLLRLGEGWKRAKLLRLPVPIRSTPEKKPARPADPAGGPASRLAAGICR